MSNKKLNANNLKDVLWSTMNSVKRGTLEPRQAAAVAGQARAILQTIRVQQQISSQSGKNLAKDVVEFSS